MANVNIVKDYSWTEIPKGSQLRSEAPFVHVRGYELDTPALAQAAVGYLNLIKGASSGGAEFYEKMYKGKKKDTFFFPYFSDSVRSFSNSFASSFSNFTDKGGRSAGIDFLDKVGGELAAAAGSVNEVVKVGSELAKATAGAMSGGGVGVDAASKMLGGVASAAGGEGPGSYIETPKFYQYENTDAPLNVDFYLANTIEEGDAEKNSEFINNFIKANRPNRKGPVTLTFPWIYKVKVPGVRYIEWAYLADLNVSFVGTRRKVGSKIIPEGYHITMSFKSLTIEPENFMDKI